AAAINQKDKQRFDYIINNEIPNSLNYISTSTTKIDKLLKALLRLSRLGRAAITKTNLDMNKLIRNVTDSSRYLIKERNVDLKIDQLPECIGDIEQINQVFTNLVSNAIKYLDPARKGQIHISGNIEGEMSVYCVKDNGIGINEDHFAKIFELFHQLEPERPESGEGLGLTIIKRILDRNNGKIWLKSKPAEGSRFYVSLPRKK
nr:GHKL domain-containing protein [Planctomycetota bacterium]